MRKLREGFEEGKGEFGGDGFDWEVVRWSMVMWGESCYGACLSSPSVLSRGRWDAR